MGCCLLDITPYPFIFHRQLADIPVFQSLNIIVLQVGGITVLVSSPGHRTCELLSWISVHRPSVSFSHLTILLWNCWTDFNQTCHTCSLDGPLPVFGVDRKFNMAARANNVFLLVETLKIFLSETTKPIELWLCRNVNRLLTGDSRWRHDSTWPYGKNV